MLRSIIRAHILTGDPVASQKVAQGTRIDLSPASIRNVMTELEERGHGTHATFVRQNVFHPESVHADG